MNDTINYLKTIREVTYSQCGVDCLTKAIEACEEIEKLEQYIEDLVYQINEMRKYSED